MLNVDVLPQQAALLRSVMMDYDAELDSVSIARMVLELHPDNGGRYPEQYKFDHEGWITGVWWSDIVPIDKNGPTKLPKQMIVIDTHNQFQTFVSNDLRPRVAFSIAHQEERMLCSLLLKKQATRIKGKPTRQSVADAVRRGCQEMLSDGAQPSLILADAMIGSLFATPAYGIPVRVGQRVVKLPDDWHIKFRVGKSEYEEHVTAAWSTSLSDAPRRYVSNIFIFGRGTCGHMFYSPVVELVPDQIYGETMSMALLDNPLCRRITCDWSA